MRIKKLNEEHLWLALSVLIHAGMVIGAAVCLRDYLAKHSFM
ncbi:hypothetical protein QU487_06425 [Crenobacter sp. SG2305]|nr:hypothetical protein [Crenobacter sp. SG2305]MDN0082388.1 hypothetical protein [Crenobacter sp. SG2305]